MRRITKKHITEKVATLQEMMHEAGILPAECSLRVQQGSKLHGNSNWVAVTGGELESAVSPIDALHLPSDATRAQFLAVINAYISALYHIKRGRVIHWMGA